MSERRNEEKEERKEKKKADDKNYGGATLKANLESEKVITQWSTKEVDPGVVYNISGTTLVEVPNPNLPLKLSHDWWIISMTGSTSTSSMASDMIAYSNSAAAPPDSSAAGRAGRSRGVASKSKAAASTSALHAGFNPPPFDSEKLPPTLVSDIRRYLRVANQVEPNWPRAAYLCKFDHVYLLTNLFAS